MLRWHSSAMPAWPAPAGHPSSPRETTPASIAYVYYQQVLTFLGRPELVFQILLSDRGIFLALGKPRRLRWRGSFQPKDYAALERVNTAVPVGQTGHRAVWLQPRYCSSQAEQGSLPRQEGRTHHARRQRCFYNLGIMVAFLCRPG
jgi:hypothetical protein